MIRKRCTSVLTAQSLSALPLAAGLSLSGCSAIDRITGQGAFADPAQFELPTGDAAAKAVINGDAVDLPGATALCTGSEEQATITARAGEATIVIGLKGTDSPTVASVTLSNVGGHTVGWMASFPGSASAQHSPVPRAHSAQAPPLPSRGRPRTPRIPLPTRSRSRARAGSDASPALWPAAGPSLHCCR